MVFLCGLEIEYGNINIKQYSKVTYFGCKLDENLSGETMALNAINKINSRLRFLYRKNIHLSLHMKRLLCYAIIRPFFYYDCWAWYPNLNKKLKSKLQKNAKQIYQVLSSTRKQKSHWDKRIWTNKLVSCFRMV